MSDLRALCSGPGRLTQALGVSADHDGLALDEPPFEIAADPDPVAEADILVGPRIGISKAADKPWRFGLAGSGFLSRRFPVPNTKRPPGPDPAS